MFLGHSAGALRCSVLVAGVLLFSHAAIAGDAGKAAIAPADTAARKACIDPATGRLVSPEERPECKAVFDDRRDDARTQEGEAGSVDQSAEGLEEEPLADDGAKVDLKGRFRQESATPPVAPAPQNGGRIAVIDPQTGQLMSGAAVAIMRRTEAMRVPLADFEAQLRETLLESQDVSGLEEERLETGAVKVDLEGAFRNPLVARIGPDRAVVVRHANPATE